MGRGWTSLASVRTESVDHVSDAGVQTSMMAANRTQQGILMESVWATGQTVTVILMGVEMSRALEDLTELR